eukprot:GHVN01057988.1.p1 GENE.GHVN01057988.1~~GHVN01057988.1.p1  ORF type:complete len:642 (+),score=80.56 GHVN01057988.1:256-2181(+)
MQSGLLFIPSFVLLAFLHLSHFVVNSFQYDSAGVVLDRAKIIVGWDEKCTQADIDTASEKAVQSGVLKVSDFLQALSARGPNSLQAEHVISHQKNRVQSGSASHLTENRRKPIVGGDDFLSLDVNVIRDALVGYLEVLAVGIVEDTIPIDSLLDDRGTLPTGYTFSAPILTGGSSEARRLTSVESNTPARSLSEFHETHGLKECEKYQGQGFSSAMTLNTRFLERVNQDVIDVPCGMSGEALVAVVEKFVPCVSFAHLDMIRRPLSATLNEKWGSSEKRKVTPGQVANLQCSGCASPDDLDRDQWHLIHDVVGSIRAQQAWTKHTGARDRVVVAVLDTGLSWHADIKANLYENQGEAGDLCSDGIDNDENGFVDDCHGWDFGDSSSNSMRELGDSVHGTPVSGTIAARGDNGYATVGVCPFCQVLPLRIDSIEGISVSAIVKAIDYMLRMNISISNNSYGGWGYSASEFQAIRELRNAGHIFVTAAGNDGCNIDTSVMCDGENPLIRPFTPCSYELDNIVCVGATSTDSSIAAFSNRGISSVDVFAPGKGIISLDNPNHHTEGYDDYTDSWDGTSFASPVVAGMIAMKIGRNPNYGYREILAELRNTARQMEHLQGEDIVELACLPLGPSIMPLLLVVGLF